MNTTTNRERPILMKGPLVLASLDGRKTQTRRLCKLDYRPGMPEPELQSLLAACPYGVPGDRLWVRESFWAFGRWETRFDAKKGRDAHSFVDMTIESGKAYQFTDPMPERSKATLSTVIPSWWRRPSIHMPRWACRLELEITGVRVERLQDISEADARAEGVEWLDHEPACAGNAPAQGWRGYLNHQPLYRSTARESFMSLWQSINGAESWEANPWLWVVEFRRVP